jgi:hypothetical protein
MGSRPPELSEVIEKHEVELACSQCQARFARSVGFLKTNREMSCPTCAATVLLDVSSIQKEVRQLEKSLRALHSQLSATMRDPKPD